MNQRCEQFGHAWDRGWPVRNIDTCFFCGMMMTLDHRIEIKLRYGIDIKNPMHLSRLERFVEEQSQTYAQIGVLEFAEKDLKFTMEEEGYRKFFDEYANYYPFRCPGCGTAQKTGKCNNCGFDQGIYRSAPPKQGHSLNSQLPPP